MEEDDFISKTQRKKRMLELQEVGVALVKLSHDQLARIELPDELRAAILEARRFTKHEAIRRQMQYIGRIMRDIDAGPIIEQLDALHAPSRKQAALLHVAERWRKELVEDPGAVARFVEEFPGADPQRLRTLAAEAQAEQRASRSPKRFRELFHVINAIIQDQSRRAS